MLPVERYAPLVRRGPASPPETLQRHDAPPDGLLDPGRCESQRDVDASSRAAPVSGDVVGGRRPPSSGEISLFGSSAIAGRDPDSTARFRKVILSR